ncbi:hypothetical protein WDZ92_31500 [Nostoc sp. NIES-2111]
MTASSVLRMGLVTSLLFSGAPVLAQDAVRVPVDAQGVTLEVTELKVTDDGYLTLRASVRNESGASTSLYKLTNSYIVGASLLDMTNKRKHLVVQDSGGNCLCSGNIDINNGETRQIWAKFAAPPENVAKMSVSFGSVEPVSVPVSR